MADKLDKKELDEPDKLQVFFMTVRAYVEQHRSKIYLGSGIFALIVLLASGWTIYQMNYEASAGKVSSKVIEASMKAGSPAGDAAAMKGYSDLIVQYPRSAAAVVAYYRLGNLHYNRNEIDAAVKAYENFLQKVSSEGDFVTLAYSSLGACSESKKDFKKALEYYEKAMNTKMAPSFEAMNFSSMGRVYEAMSISGKATEYYRKALEKTTDPLMTIYLKRKIAILG